jgi:D-inositol-3-phosphate glycosyltransferase
MKICLVAESYPPAIGGVEFSLQKLVEGFVAGGNEVRVITSSWQRHDSGTETRGGLTVRRIRTLPFLHRFSFLFLALPDVIRSARWADIVQGSTFAGGPIAFLGGWLAGKKKVLLVHEVFGKRWFEYEPNVIRALFYFVTERIIVRLPFDHYVAPSQYTRDSLRSIGVRDGSMSVIHHGEPALEMPSVPAAQVRSRLGFREEDFVFLSYGRTGVTKGFELLADAILDVANHVPRARFVMILSGYDRRIWTRLNRKVSSLPAGTCTLLQSVPRERLAEYVLATDCVVIPSLSEGFGFSALEACNANKAVVSTDAGSLPEVVFGRCVFVKPGSAQAIAEGCLKASRGELHLVPTKTFSWERAVQEYLQLYAQILAA